MIVPASGDCLSLIWHILTVHAGFGAYSRRSGFFKMQNDECGMQNEESARDSPLAFILHSAFTIHFPRCCRARFERCYCRGIWRAGGVTDRRFFMNRLVNIASGLMLGAMVLVGCGGPNEYHPNAEPTQLAAYAATKPYPANAQPQE